MDIETSIKIFKCPYCKNIHSIKEWDTSTITTCNNRRVRRQFKSLALTSSRDKGSSRTYVCPSCSKFVSGKNILIDTERF